MKFSKLFAPTIKEGPKDAQLPSHKFLIRAGYIEQLGSGLYNFLPLGKMVLDNIKNIIKEEMDNSGAQEVQFSFVTPSDFWKSSGRLGVYGKELLRLKDRKGNDFVLSPTNEESAVNMVKNRINSYKDLPIHIYQINTKFRDEARPRFGLLRGREFLMKDGYSFHANEQDLQREFDLMYEVYCRIFTRLGLNFRAVDADSGAIGGSGSKEFMLLAQNGEDDILVCKNCNYASNIEAAVRKKIEFTSEPIESNMYNKFFTPGANTIEKVSEFFKVDKFFTIKAVIKKAIFQDVSKIVVFFVRGCDDLQEKKAQNACGAFELVDASIDEILNCGLVPGYCGPVNLPSGIDFYIDSELKGSKDMICGANEKDYHVIGLNVVNFNESRFVDLITVKNGDKCRYCSSLLTQTRGIEVGHIFKLADKYSKAMGATFLDENGKSKNFLMGCYGIGVSRLVAAIIESSFDEKGCVFNKNVAAFNLCIIISNYKDKAQVEYANNLYEKCLKIGIKVLLDDRKERFGVKMNDYELMGFPFAIVIGKNLENNVVEFITRAGLKKEEVCLSEILNLIKDKIC